MPVSVVTVVKHVLVGGLAVYAPSEPIKPADSDAVLDAINTVLDDWAVETAASYAETWTVYVTTGVNPQTLGPTGTWVTPIRPVKIDSVSVEDSPGVWRRIFTTDDPTWWDAQQVLTSPGVPFGVFYSADEPNGMLHFNSPLPSGVRVRLMQRTTIGPVLLTDVLVLPQGYQSALELTVMEAVCDAFHATVTPSQIARAGKARARIFANNLRIPTLRAFGVGLPGMDDRTLLPFVTNGSGGFDGGGP